MMKRYSILAFFYIAASLPALVFAAAPLLTFSPLTATSLTLSTNDTATVQYLVENQSTKAHTLLLEPIAGLRQITGLGDCPNPFTLAFKQACTLRLQVNGSQLAGNIFGGPVACEQGSNGQPNPLLCYQPSQANSLSITFSPGIFYAGTQDGNVYYSFNNGLTWTATSLPDGNNSINGIYVTTTNLYVASADGFIYYSSNRGGTWTSTTSPDGSSVNCIFVVNDTLYAGTANGSVYISVDGGLSWISTTMPDGSSVNGIFVSGSSIYVGTANGNVYLSTDNGASWLAINGQPNGSSIKNVFISGGHLYINTADEYVYTSTSLTGGGSWTPFAQTVYTLFVSPTYGTLYAGTQSGYLTSLTAGSELGFVTFNPITSLYMTN